MLSWYCRAHLLLCVGTKTQSLHKGPVRVDLLTQHRGSLQIVDGSLRIVVVLVLHQRVSLDESGTAIHIHVEILDGAILRAQIEHVLLLRLFVNIRQENNPSFNCYHSNHNPKTHMDKDPFPWSRFYQNDRHVPRNVGSPLCSMRCSLHVPSLRNHVIRSHANTSRKIRCRLVLFITSSLIHPLPPYGTSSVANSNPTHCYYRMTTSNSQTTLPLGNSAPTQNSK